MLVQVIGKPVRYNGKYHQAGSIVDMKPAHANLFMILQKVALPDVKLPVEEQEREVSAERAFDHPSLDEMSKPKRKYKRRDMQAE
ncbi:MAG: hypothetical protein AB7E55_23440 [Pigmentiphaga sp.]